MDLSPNHLINSQNIASPTEKRKDGWIRQHKLLIVLVNGVPVGSTPFDGRAKALFEEDLQVAREYGVRGFPRYFLSIIEAKGSWSTVRSPIRFLRPPGNLRSSPESKGPKARTF